MRAAILRGKRGLTPVVSTMILSAIVITIGGAVWAYSQGAATLIAKDYVEGRMSLMNEAIERYAIEHVSYQTDTKTLRVWIYNYGGIDIVVDVYASVQEGPSGSAFDKAVASKNVIEVDISLDAPSGSEIAIKAVSRRGNNAYSLYFVP